MMRLLSTPSIRVNRRGVFSIETNRPYRDSIFGYGEAAGGAYCRGEGGVQGPGGETGRKETTGGPRHRLADNIRMDLQEVGCVYRDWIGLAQDRDRWRTLVSAVMNLRVLCNAGNFLTSCKPLSFSRRSLHHGVSK